VNARAVVFAEMEDGSDGGGFGAAPTVRKATSAQPSHGERNVPEPVVHNHCWNATGQMRHVPQSLQARRHPHAMTRSLPAKLLKPAPGVLPPNPLGSTIRQSLFSMLGSPPIGRRGSEFDLSMNIPRLSDGPSKCLGR